MVDDTKDKTAEVTTDSGVTDAVDGQADESEVKPKRRRRRRKTAAEKKAEMEAAAAATEAGDQPDISSPDQQPAASAEKSTDCVDVPATTISEPVVAEDKPKRPRRSRKTAAEEKAEVEAAIAAALEGKTQPEDKPSDLLPAVQQERPLMVLSETKDASTPDEPEQKPKRRRRRKTVAEKRAELNAAAEAAKTEKSKEAPADQTPAEVDTKINDVANAPTPATGSNETPEEKPKRRRRRKTVAEKRAELNEAAAKKAAENATVPVAAQAVTTVPTEPEVVTEKPKRPRRKPAAKKSDTADVAEMPPETKVLPDSTE